MSAQQSDFHRPNFASTVQRISGSLTPMLFGTAILMAGWGISWEEEATGAQGAFKPKAISGLKVHTGTPDGAYPAPSSGSDHAQARKMNAAIPFARSPGAAAFPFRFVGTGTDRIRATDCLAIAAMAESGHGEDGQRAVIQVVLNRVRHTAFAKTICGVVFEGSHRATGCQFTFTCDGALARRYSAASWTRARARATQALDGHVYAPVGLATHYHTDWVHPYWSGTLTKLSRVDTHLFFRWPGNANPTSLSVPYRGNEPVIGQLAYLPAHSEVPGTSPAQPFANQLAGDMGLGDVVVRNEDGGAFILLTGAPTVTSAREMGRGICGDRPSCKVFGWFDRAAVPQGYPVSAQSRRQLGFSYFRDARNKEIVLYDCARFSNVGVDGCIP